MVMPINGIFGSSGGRVASIVRMFANNTRTWERQLAKKTGSRSSTLSAQSANSLTYYAALPVEAKENASDARERQYIPFPNLASPSSIKSNPYLQSLPLNLDSNITSSDDKILLNPKEVKLQQSLWNQLGLGHMINLQNIMLAYRF